MAMLDKAQIEDILEQIQIDLAKTALRWRDLEKLGLVDLLGAIYLEKFAKLKQRQKSLRGLLRERHSGHAVEEGEPDSTGTRSGSVENRELPRITGPVARDPDGAAWADAT